MMASAGMSALSQAAGVAVMVGGAAAGAGGAMISAGAKALSGEAAFFDETVTVRGLALLPFCAAPSPVVRSARPPADPPPPPSHAPLT